MELPLTSEGYRLKEHQSGTHPEEENSVLGCSRAAAVGVNSAVVQFLARRTPISTGSGNELNSHGRSLTEFQENATPKNMF